MAAMESGATTTEDPLMNTYLFHQLDEYPWDTDQEFQGGLRAILGDVQDPAQTEHLTLRAKCYYFARKAGAAVDFEGYRRWVEGNREGAREGEATNGLQGPTHDVASHQQSSVNELNAEVASAAEQNASSTEGGVGGMGNAPYSASFAEICDMIAEGKPIPGIKDIPDTILEGQSSESATQGRKKPWEKASESEASTTPSWMK